MENKTAFITKKLLEPNAKIGFAYREEPDNETDSGWRFFSGSENQEYVDNPDNLLIRKLEEVINIDSSITEILDNGYGTAFEKRENNFVQVTDFHFGNEQ